MREFLTSCWPRNLVSKKLFTVVFFSPRTKCDAYFTAKSSSACSVVGLSVDSYFTLHSVGCAIVSAWRAELCVAMATWGWLAIAPQRRREFSGDMVEYKTSQSSLEVTELRLCSVPVAFPPFYTSLGTSLGLQMKGDLGECEIDPKPASSNA
ncbi:hypothetical protein SRHO_G00222790 [Serrasalmus rhombeus]